MEFRDLKPGDYFLVDTEFNIMYEKEHGFARSRLYKKTDRWCFFEEKQLRHLPADTQVWQMVVIVDDF